MSLSIRAVLSAVCLLILLLALPCGVWGNVQVVILGDSLTRGLGVAQEDAFPQQLETMLRAKGHAVTVVNAGVNGSTTASGLSRLQWSMRSHPAIVVLALGANDGLRGKPTSVIEENLGAIIAYAQEHNAKVLLAGMQLPLSYGNAYRQEYAAIFPKLATKYHVPLIPFLLEGVAGIRDLNQADGMHPNEKGHKVIAHTVMKYLEPILEPMR